MISIGRDLTGWLQHVATTCFDHTTKDLRLMSVCRYRPLKYSHKAKTAKSSQLKPHRGLFLIKQC